MKKIIAGSLAILLGIFGLAAAFPSFLTLLTGIIPFMLIIGGGLAIYLNYEGNSQDCSTATDCLDNSCEGNSQDCSTATDCLDNSCDTTIPPSVKSQESEPADTSAEIINSEITEPEKPVIPEEPVIIDKEPEQRIIDTAKGNSGQLLGNTESRVFHNPDCKFSKSKNCTAVFKTKEEAIQDGYKPCGICKP